MGLFPILREFRKHLHRINGDKYAVAARQNFALFVGYFRDIGVFLAIHMLCLPGDDQGLSQRYRPEILNVHLSGEGNYVVELVYLAHGFIQDGGDDAAMRMAGRTLIAARQPEFAGGAAGFFLQIEPQPHSIGIVLTAAKAMVFQFFIPGMNGVAVRGFLVFHEDCAF